MEGRGRDGAEVRAGARYLVQRTAIAGVHRDERLGAGAARQRPDDPVRGRGVAVPHAPRDPRVARGRVVGRLRGRADVQGRFEGQRGDRGGVVEVVVGRWVGVCGAGRQQRDRGGGKTDDQGTQAVGQPHLVPPGACAGGCGHLRWRGRRRRAGSRSWRWRSPRCPRAGRRSPGRAAGPGPGRRPCRQGRRRR